MNGIRAFLCDLSMPLAILLAIFPALLVVCADKGFQKLLLRLGLSQRVANAGATALFGLEIFLLVLLGERFSC